MKTVITTSGRPDDLARQRSMEAAKVLGYPIIERNKRSIASLQEIYKASVLVAGANRFELYRIGMDKPFFFHPNSAAFRLKRLQAGEMDPLVVAATLKPGDTFLDCTLGLASDSIIASFVVGESGLVTGIEADMDIAFITGRGLHSFPTGSETLMDAMGRTHVVQANAVEFLRSEPDASWDVVYIDPMFNAPIAESSNFTPLRQVGLHSSLTDEWVEEARRVSKRRVVVKDHFDSPIFEKYGFEQQIRLNTKFHFGFILK